MNMNKGKGGGWNGNKEKRGLEEQKQKMILGGEKEVYRKREVELDGRIERAEVIS